jgi:signal peptidase I
MSTASRITGLARRALDLVLLGLVVVVLLTIAVARVIPALTRGTTVVVTGPSMAPAIPVGAAVLVYPVATERLGVGDIVSVRTDPDRAIFTHRVVRLIPRPDGLWIETRGDANGVADPPVVPATAVLGRVELTVPLLGYLIALLSTPQGIVLLMGFAGSLLAALWLVEGLEVDRRAGTRRRIGATGEPIARRQHGDALRGVDSALPPR